MLTHAYDHKVKKAKKTNYVISGKLTKHNQKLNDQFYDYHMHPKVISKELLDFKRHMEFNYCLYKGRRDGTLIWGRKVHVRRLNTKKLLDFTKEFKKKI